jgi:hypothetical protein
MIPVHQRAIGMAIYLGLSSRVARKQRRGGGDGGTVFYGDRAIETPSNRTTGNLISNLVNATSEFTLTYQRGLLEGLINEDLVPGSVGTALNYPPVWDIGKGDSLALNLPMW